MGAKTNKFIQDIEAATLDLAAPAFKIKQFENLLEDLRDASARSLEQFDRRVSELEKEYGAKAHTASPEGQELEKALNGGDPTIKAIAKADDERNKQLFNGVKAKKAAVAELTKQLAPFAKQVDEFEDYIVKKEKSKNPFKSKKSLPEAKKFVARMRELYRDMQAMAK